jgi:hypothetical protein
MAATTAASWALETNSSTVEASEARAAASSCEGRSSKCWRARVSLVVFLGGLVEGRRIEFFADSSRSVAFSLFCLSPLLLSLSTHLRVFTPSCASSLAAAAASPRPPSARASLWRSADA